MERLEDANWIIMIITGSGIVAKKDCYCEEKYDERQYTRVRCHSR